MPMASAVIAEDEAQTQFRETYRVLDQSHWTYTADGVPRQRSNLGAGIV